MLLLATSCAVGTIYKTPDFAAYKASHRSVAILPFDVKIDQTNRGSSATTKELKKLQIKQGMTFQRELYAEFLKGQQLGKYTIELQDIDKTNTLLTREPNTELSGDALASFTKPEWCEVLGVDAVISGQMILYKPMGNVAAPAVRLIFDEAGTTNEGYVNIAIHEGVDGKLLWNYKHTIGRGILSSEEKLAQDLVKGGTVTFSYKR